MFSVAVHGIVLFIASTVIYLKVQPDTTQPDLARLHLDAVQEVPAAKSTVTRETDSLDDILGAVEQVADSQVHSRLPVMDESFVVPDAASGSPLASVVGSASSGSWIAPASTDQHAIRPQGGVSFFSSTSAAARVVFLVDRSGSMTTTFPALQEELKNTVRAMQPTQKFSIIFFNQGPPLVSTADSDGTLVWATHGNKQRTAAFIDRIQPSGKTDPAAALRMAFQMSPDLVYLLTDGDFPAQIVDMIDRLNSSRHVRINTIAYCSHRGGKTLRTIAQRNNGQYTFVSEEQLFFR